MGIVIDTTEAVRTKKLFDSFYVIPDFQRDFIWKKKQVVQLLVDVYGAFHSGDDDNYFVALSSLSKPTAGRASLWLMGSSD